MKINVQAAKICRYTCMVVSQQILSTHYKVYVFSLLASECMFILVTFSYISNMYLTMFMLLLMILNT